MAYNGVGGSQFFVKDVDPGRRLIESHTSKDTWAAQIACYRFVFFLNPELGGQGRDESEKREGREERRSKYIV